MELKQSTSCYESPERTRLDAPDDLPREQQLTYRRFLHPLLLRGASEALGRFVIRHTAGSDNGKTGGDVACRDDVPEAEPILRERRMHQAHGHSEGRPTSLHHGARLDVPQSFPTCLECLARAADRILGPLGAGGMGEVCRARDTRPGRDVPIRGLPSEVAEDDERHQRFEREARVLASLHDTNVAGFHGVGEDEAGSFLMAEDGRVLGTPPTSTGS